MGKFLFKTRDLVQQRKKFLWFLIILSVLVAVLAVVFAVNKPSDIYEVKLTNIAYIQYLAGSSGVFSTIIKMSLSLLIFLSLILVCGARKIFFPMAVLFYLYFVYSQIFVFMNLMFYYGFANCVILLLLLIGHTVANCSLFIFILIEQTTICGRRGYFGLLFKISESSILIYLILMILLCVLFCLVLLILKSFVILLVF